MRLDAKVNPHHARLTAVSDGYRVRSIGSATVRVNGKSAGPAKSRIIRPDGVLQVGNTEFCFQAASGGLASKSRGLARESDYAWLLGQVFKKLALVLRLLIRTVQSVPKKLLKHWFAVLVVVGIVAFLKPEFRYWLQVYVPHYARNAWYYVQNLVSN